MVHSEFVVIAISFSFSYNITNITVISCDRTFLYEHSVKHVVYRENLRPFDLVRSHVKSHVWKEQQRRLFDKQTRNNPQPVSMLSHSPAPLPIQPVNKQSANVQTCLLVILKKVRLRTFAVIMCRYAPATHIQSINTYLWQRVSVTKYCHKKTYIRNFQKISITMFTKTILQKTYDSQNLFHLTPAESVYKYIICKYGILFHSDTVKLNILYWSCLPGLFAQSLICTVIVTWKSWCTGRMES